MQMLTILTRNHQFAEPEVEIDEFSMTYLNVDALQESENVRGSEWIKIGVDTGAGKDGMVSEYHARNDDSWRQ